MQVLIFGKKGQIAGELGRARWPEHWTVRQFSRTECDLRDTGLVMEAMLAVRPEIVINAAAYTAVDRSETEPEAAERLNLDAPAAMASACRELGAALIHLSTDYVFDGSKTEPYLEEDSVAPLSVYGRTKAKGEFAIHAALPQHIILRTSWVFAAHGDNFVRTMLRLANERAELRIVADQRGAPTSARDIAKVIAMIAQRISKGNAPWGTFHFTSTEPVTWFDFARVIFELSGRHPQLFPITTAEYGARARRPLNSVLDCSRIEREFGIRQPSWRLALKEVLPEMCEMADSAGGLLP